MAPGKTIEDPDVYFTPDSGAAPAPAEDVDAAFVPDPHTPTPYVVSKDAAPDPEAMKRLHVTVKGRENVRDPKGFGNWLMSNAIKFNQGAFSNLHDEIGGAATAAWQDNDPKRIELDADGHPVPFGTNTDQYVAGRDMTRAMTEGADKQLGWWKHVPQTAGAVAQYYLGKGAFDKAGKALTPALEGMNKVRQAANIAGANSVVPAALNAVGMSTADLTEGEIPQAIGETVLGTVLGTGGGGLTGGAMNVGGAVLDKVGFNKWLSNKMQGGADKMRDLRDYAFFKILNTRKKDFKAMDHLDNEGDISQFAFDKKMVGPLTTADDLAERGAAERAVAGTKVGGAISEGDARATSEQLPDAYNVLAQLRARRLEIERRPGAARLLPKIDEEINAIENSLIARAQQSGKPTVEGKSSFLENERENKSSYDDLDFGQDKITQRAAKEARNAFKQESEKNLEKIDPGLAKRFGDAKSDSGNAQSIQALAKDAVAAEKASGISRWDQAGGAAGMLYSLMKKDPTSIGQNTVAGMLAGRAAKNFGPAAAATSANKVYGGLQSLANAAPDDVARYTGNPAGRNATPEEIAKFWEWLKAQDQSEKPQQ